MTILHVWLVRHRSASTVMESGSQPSTPDSFPPAHVGGAEDETAQTKVNNRSVNKNKNTAELYIDRKNAENRKPDKSRDDGIGMAGSGSKNGHIAPEGKARVGSATHSRASQPREPGAANARYEREATMPDISLPQMANGGTIH